jgi:hypothetical protein
MLVICNIIHHRSHNVPFALGPQQVLNIAVTADKYDCVHILKFVAPNWLGDQKTMDCKDYARMMVAAYYLGDGSAFKLYSGQLVLHSKGSLLRLLDDEEFKPYLTADTICAC